MTARATEASLRAAELVRIGGNPAKVAKLLGLHVATVRRACHRAGVSLKPVGRPKTTKPATAGLLGTGMPAQHAGFNR